MAKNDKDGRKGTVGGTTNWGISDIIGGAPNKFGTNRPTNLGYPPGWSGVGPVPAKNHKVAEAALALLRAFDDGTALS